MSLSLSSCIQRLETPDKLKDILLSQLQPANDSVPSQTVSWDDLSLAAGYPSLLLLFSVLEQKGVEKSDEIALRYAIKIKESIETRGLSTDLSLFSGVAGICFALEHASCGQPRYRRMLDALHNFLISNIKSFYLDPLYACLEKGLAVPVSLYDPIQGLCGIGRYALVNKSVSGFGDICLQINQALVAFCQSKMIQGYEVPGWYLSQNDPINWNYTHTKGNFNLGLAHGISGVLAFFAISALQGVVVDGQKEAIDFISRWICKHAFYESGLIYWPTHVSFEDVTNQTHPQKKERSKDAWCYGVPGVSRSLFLAGKSLRDTTLMNFAKEAFLGVFSRDPTAWQLPGPALCHGIAGLMTITKAMAEEKGCEGLSENVQMLYNLLLSFYNPKSPFGFRDVEPSEKGECNEVDKVGFLDGAVGVWLALETIENRHSRWRIPLFLDDL